MLDETDTTLTKQALIEIRLELAEPDVIFRPPIDKNLSGNFYDLVEGYVEDTFKMCALVPRIATHKASPFAIDPLKAKLIEGDTVDNSERSFADETPSETFDDKNPSVCALKERAIKRRNEEISTAFNISIKIVAEMWFNT